ncbi:hypothetical protein ACFOOK_05910 [Micromonospora krabiensis]|uniref:Uncharacterized protein n=1 Tax=Micromonospora krabiensis TaxID=307121 RepID=A0A1C3ND46_9ACTN|nr:hypothetical protein [Micromonospora krabiensis]SBV30470.1 hypothetical protein GA0070620_6067 [Micromonospora krabiensis]
MVATDPGSAREEAERLVATLLATARVATSGSAAAGQWGPIGGMVASVLGHSVAPGGSSRPTGGGFATGTAECCICPVCRGIAALRDPSPEFAERLATGAGDLAAGVASLLRALASANPPAPPADHAPEGPGTPAAGPDDDLVWRDATRSGHDSQPAPERDVWSAATRAEEKAAPAGAGRPVEEAGTAAPATVRPVVPASREPGDVGVDAAGDGA